MEIFRVLQAKGRRRHSRKTDPESEESDSDPDQLTSSRTESSNQLDAKLKHSMSERENVVNLYQINIDKKFPGLIYHGTQSSTSSDLSPMSEQKSLPRRGRQRYHLTHHNTNTTPRHKPQASSTTNHSPPLLPAANIQVRMPSQFRPIHSSRAPNSPKC